MGKFKVYHQQLHGLLTATARLLQACCLRTYNMPVNDGATCI